MTQSRTWLDRESNNTCKGPGAWKSRGGCPGRLSCGVAGLEGVRDFCKYGHNSGEGLRNLAVGGAGSGESELVPEQGPVCLIWIFGLYVRLCLDSMGQHTCFDSPVCTRSGLSPAQVPVPAWKWARGKGTCVAIQVRGDRDPAEPSALGVSMRLCRGSRGWPMAFRSTQALRLKSLGDCDRVLRRP